ncbi:MAG: hypothetical protein LQ349_007720 [Xanthoria aureola]|nr:MAG: hypothetical protein LQ349_007720 [Xanthoria aureola]
MAGQKHHLNEKDMNTSDISPFMPMFQGFRDELDEHQERRERIIKASRDITALSKKIVRHLQQPIPPPIAKEINTRYKSIQELFTTIAPDLQGINSWRYQKQVSGGCQEFVEAISFQHYLETQRLLTHAEAQALIPGGVELTTDDYVLGLFDLTGELMRFGITNIATNGTLPRGPPAGEGSEGKDILMDLRAIRTHFESLDTSSGPNDFSYLKKDIQKKTEVMRESVGKVEYGAYGMIIRGRERPKGWVPDMNEGQDRGREPVESY